jgi:integrase
MKDKNKENKEEVKYEDPRTLVNSKKNEVWAKNFLKRLKDRVNEDGEEVTLVLGDLKRNPKEYTILRENLQKIVEYVSYLENNSLAKTITAGRVANLLIYFGSWFKKPFKEVKREDIERFFESISDYSECYKATFRRIIKPFFRWLYGYEKGMGYPEVVEWIYGGVNKNERKLPNILTMEEITKMVEVCDNLRDRALVSFLYESGCRASEILDLKIKDVNFDEYGAYLIVNGKTGSRRIRLISSVADLKQWLNVHPRKNEPDAPLFCALTKNNKGNPLGDSSLDFIVQQIAKKAGINKRVYPHLFRHTRATHLSKHLTEQELKVWFGWTRNSDMASIYVHLSGKDVEDKILQLAGVKQKEEGNPPTIPNIKCYRCGEVNSIGNEFCFKCGAPLTEEKIKEVETTIRFLGELLPLISERIKEGKDFKALDDVVEIFKTIYKKKVK